MVDEDQGGAGIAPPGQYAEYADKVASGDWHLSGGFARYLRETSKKAPVVRRKRRPSLWEKITHQIWYWRGRLSDWIAPEGWNDE